MIKHLGLKAYGKVNLGLDVVRRREDGYHEVRMIMQTVGIYDRIDLMRREQPGIGIETNLYYLPDNENNLAYKAARLLMDEFDIKEGVNIRIKKFIPVAAGMAGSPLWSQQDVFPGSFHGGTDEARRKAGGRRALLPYEGNRAFRGDWRDSDAA